jgi:hypothetical protein
MARTLLPLTLLPLIDRVRASAADPRATFQPQRRAARAR